MEQQCEAFPIKRWEIKVETWKFSCENSLQFSTVSLFDGDSFAFERKYFKESCTDLKWIPKMAKEAMGLRRFE